MKKRTNILILTLCLVMMAAIALTSCASDKTNPDGGTQQGNPPSGSEPSDSGTVTPPASEPGPEEPDTPPAVTEGLAYRLLSDSTYEVSVGTATEVAHIVIPETYQEKAVTRIADLGFYNCSQMTRITIPDSVTDIGDSAFSGCDQLTYTVHENGKYLGNSSNPYVVLVAVADTTVTSFTIPDATNVIFDSAFSGCGRLANIHIPDGITSIGMGAFDGCDSLDYSAYYYNGMYLGNRGNPYLVLWKVDPNCSSYGINNATKFIYDSAFKNCASMTSITVPDGVTSIGKEAFYECSGLTGVTLGNSVKEIGAYAFSFCGSLTDITIPNSVTDIGEGAFVNCTSLIGRIYGHGNYLGNSDNPYMVLMSAPNTSITSFTVPETTVYIANGAFKDCSGLTSVTLPNGITSIEDSVFYGCSSLTSITIPESVTVIGHYAFYGCGSLTNVQLPDNLLGIGWATFENCVSLTGISIPKGIYGINGCLFTGCSSLSSVSISDSVRTIGTSAFRGCVGLSSIRLPDSVTSIGERAFADCSSLTTVEHGNNLTYIGENSFYNCSALTSFEMTNGLQSIGEDAFNGCSSLTSITIPDSLREIGDRAFSRCTGLTSVTIPYDSGILYGDSILSGSNNIVTATVPTALIPDMPTDYLQSLVINGGEKIEYGWFDNCDTLTSVTIGEGVTSIAAYAFDDCDSLTGVSIPDSIAFIDVAAFAGCNNLTYNTVNGLKCIGNAKNPCVVLVDVIDTSVTSVTIPDTTKIIGAGAFSSCNALSEVVIPGSVTQVSYSAFYDCNGLTSITIPFVGETSDSETCPTFGDIFGGVAYVPETLRKVVITGGTKIPKEAFSSCTNLTSITIPASVKSIGESAFWYCEGLTEVHISDLAAWCQVEMDSYWGTNPLCYARYLYLNGQLVTDLVIPETVTTVGAYTFYNAKFTSIFISDTVTKIENGAFCDCGVEKVFFKGTESRWDRIQIGSDNSAISEKVLFYSPRSQSGCWRYVNGVPTAW